MGLLEKLRGELVDIVEWIDDTQHTLVWRFPRFQNEIKNGAKLVVRPGQKAIFVDQGRIADSFEPGLYTLTTENLPILSTIRGWKYGFESPFKAEVYFVSTRQVTDLKWGTPNPIMLRDPDFGPLRIRAFGTYALQARDPKALLEQLVGTDGVFEAEEVRELLRSVIVSAFADLLGEAKIAALDLAAKYAELSEALRQKVLGRIADEYGLDVPQLFIVNISLPEEVEKALDTRS
ncbi:MAG: SPFH domain-containing protein, partial [Acidobacteria bacterium]|nr:SPFH domain-containing protein [Acidobacteriota bacterium]